MSSENVAVPAPVETPVAAPAAPAAPKPRKPRAPKKISVVASTEVVVVKEKKPRVRRDWATTEHSDVTFKRKDGREVSFKAAKKIAKNPRKKKEVVAAPDAPAAPLAASA